MRLTRYSDYALRVLMYMGVSGERLVTIDEISDAYGISRNHVMKVVYNLGRLGHIRTVRGRNGGMTLAREPGAINLGKLVREMENDLALVECLGPDNRCCLAPGCLLKGALDEAMAAFMGVLDRYTLADLIMPRQELRTLLAMSG